MILGLFLAGLVGHFATITPKYKECKQLNFPQPLCKLEKKYHRLR